MNGNQIESILQLIDGNIELTRSEATEYIRKHKDEIVQSLAQKGSAVVRTSAGDLCLTEADLEAVAG